MREITYTSTSSVAVISALCNCYIISGFYDYIVLCRVKTNLQINPQSLTEDSLEVMAKSLEVKLQVVGMIENKELAEIINSGKYKIYQGDTLNQSTIMDADNYYIQSGAFVLYE